MYLDNKYTRTYYAIIERAISRNFKTRKTAKRYLEYAERHHIIPRSMGGDDSPHNLVFLSAREHFICHLLLSKMTVKDDRQKMIFALTNFKNRKKNKIDRYKIGSRTYETIRKSHSAEVSKMMTGKKPWNKGLSQTADSNKKRSETMSGRQHSEEHRKNNSESRKGKKRKYSDNAIKNIIAAANLRKGISLTADQVKSRIGNIWWNNGNVETLSKIQPDNNYVRGRLKRYVSNF